MWYVLGPIAAVVLIIVLNWVLENKYGPRF
jgi:hypothetical protein